MFAGPLPLRYRIALTIFVLQAVVMALTLGITLSFSHNSARNSQEQDEALILNLLTDLSRVSLFTAEFDELQHHMEQVARDPHVVKVYLANENGKIVISTDFDHLGQPLPDLPSVKNHIWKKRDIDGVGVLAIQFSEERLQANLSTVIGMGFWIALAGMSIVTIAGLIFGRLLTTKLTILRDKARQFAQGDLMVRIGFSGRDEISVVGTTLDQMAEKISESFMQLQQARNELELRVEERTSELKQLNSRLRLMSKTDALTSISNRGHFDVTFSSEWERYKRGLSPLAIILIDIDFFKPYNDNYGHQKGDQVLTQVAMSLRNAIHRSTTDFIARYGGEEFVVILPGTDINGAQSVAENLHTAVRDLNIPHHYSSVSDIVTISMGLASTQNCSVSSSEDLLLHADLALYRAKGDGRNRTMLYQHS